MIPRADNRLDRIIHSLLKLTLGISHIQKENEISIIDIYM